MCLYSLCDLRGEHYSFIEEKKKSILQFGSALRLQKARTDSILRYRNWNIGSKGILGVDKNQQTSCSHPFVPTELSDSSITSLAGLVKDLSQNQLRTGIEEQLAILETNGIDLGRFADYLAENLWSDRQTLEHGLEIDSYANPSVMDVLKVRLLGLYQVGFHPEFLRR